MIKCPFCDFWLFDYDEWYNHLKLQHDIDKLIDKIVERQEKRKTNIKEEQPK